MFHKRQVLCHPICAFSTFTTLCANSADDKLMTFFLYLPPRPPHPRPPPPPPHVKTKQNKKNKTKKKKKKKNTKKHDLTFYANYLQLHEMSKPVLFPVKNMKKQNKQKKKKKKNINMSPTEFFPSVLSVNMQLQELPSADQIVWMDCKSLWVKTFADF